jgi:hypothetical protein
LSNIIQTRTLPPRSATSVNPLIQPQATPTQQGSNVKSPALGNFGRYGVIPLNLQTPSASRTPPHLVKAAAELCVRFLDAVNKVMNQMRHDFRGSTLAARAARCDAPPTQSFREPGVVANLQALVGQSFAPRIAETLLHKLQFDGVGRLLGPKPGAPALTAQEWTNLVSARLAKGLDKTNASGVRDAARTEREILLDLASHLRHTRAGAPPTLHGRLDAAIEAVKTQWLNLKATPGAASTADFITDLANAWTQDLPDLAQASRLLATEASHTKTVTQTYDNTFGRQFESALVHEMVKHPPATVLKAAAQTGDFLVRHFASLPPDVQGKALAKLADNLGHDPRPWHAETPDVGRFLAQPSMANLAAMLKPDTPNGFDVVKMSWVGVKASISMPDSHPAPWMAQANDNYSNVVTPARSQKDSLTGFGTKLQSLPAVYINREIDQLMTQRGLATAPVARKLVEEQHLEVRKAFDKVAFSAHTPAELQQALTNIRDHSEWMDPEVQALLDRHIQHLASMPDQHTPFDTVQSSLDAQDQKQLAASGARFQAQQTTGYGTALAHQPALKGGDHWGAGLSVQGKTTLDMAHVKAFDANALAHEMNSVNGPSGSTNIMTFLYLQMQKENPAFNLQDAFAGTMMFLTFDGGHSLPESVGTYRAITSDTRSTLELGLPKSKRNEIMDQRRQVLETSVLAYGELSQLFGHAETAQGVSDAVDRAWARTEQTFEQLHAERLSNPS